MRRILALVCVAIAVGIAWGQTTKPTATGFQDEATFILYRGEKVESRVECTWKSEDSFTSHGKVTVGGNEVDYRFTMTPGEDKKELRIEQQAGDQQSKAVIDGKTLREEHDSRSVEIPERSFVFDNFSPPLFSKPIRAFDRERKGPQPLALLLPHVVVVPGTLELLDTKLHKQTDKTLSLDHFRYAVAGASFEIYADKDGRIYRMTNAAQKADYVRGGFEFLRKDGG